MGVKYLTSGIFKFYFFIIIISVKKKYKNIDHEMKYFNERILVSQKDLI